MQFKYEALYDGDFGALIETEGYPLINNVVDEGLDSLESENKNENIKPELQNNWEYVKNAAQDLLNTSYQILYDEQQSETAIREHMRSVQALQKEIMQITSGKDKVRKNAERKLILEKVLNLQNAIANFFGYKFKIGYLYIKNGTLRIWEDENTLNHWTSDGRLYESRMKSLKSTAVLLNADKEKWNEEFDKLNATFHEVVYREGVSKARIKQNYFFIFWKLRNTGKYKWAGYKVSNEGLIGEAYFNFYIHKDNNFNQGVESNVGRYMVVGVGDVDNMSGFLRGDTSAGKYEYVVKANKAEFMKYTEIITKYATEIASITSQQDLEAIILKIDYSLQENAKKLAKPIYTKEIVKDLKEDLALIAKGQTK